MKATATANSGFFGLLAIVFITLKLTGYITWSWWWVLAPIWGVWVLLLLIAVVAVLVMAMAER